MKRLFTSLMLVCAATVAFAQNSILRPRMEIAEFESEENGVSMEVFYMDDESPRVYYLSLGHLGVGSDIVQVQFDPLFELFIPLGNTLDEAIEKMEEIKDYYKQPRLWSTEITGNFAIGYPNNEPVTVTVTSRRLLATKLLEFGIPYEDLVRATYVNRASFSSMVGSLKFYRRLHPNEQ